MKTAQKCRIWTQLWWTTMGKGMFLTFCGFVGQIFFSIDFANMCKAKHNHDIQPSHIEISSFIVYFSKVWVLMTHYKRKNGQLSHTLVHFGKFVCRIGCWFGFNSKEMNRKSFSFAYLHDVRFGACSSWNKWWLISDDVLLLVNSCHYFSK